MEADRMYLTGTEGVVMTSEGEYFHANLGQHLFIQSKVGNFYKVMHFQFSFFCLNL